MNVINKCNSQIKNDFNDKLNEFMKSEETKNTYSLGLNSYLYNLPIEYLGGRVETYAQRTGIYKTIDDKLNKINSKIKELKLQYLNNNSNNNSNENSNNNSNNNSNENSNNNSNNNSENENKNLNFDNCFVKHGKSKYNLKLGELMKLSNIKDIKEFKKTLIDKNIIKNDYLVGSTYRLTEQQKNN